MLKMVSKAVEKNSNDCKFLPPFSENDFANKRVVHRFMQET